MKLTVFATFILVLMIGFTIVQMNGNTETPFQALSETEMLTTQGAGGCTNVASTISIGEGTYCGDHKCQPWGFGLSMKQSASTYSTCAGETWILDCIGYSDNNTQTCAVRYHYYLPNCWGWSNTVDVPIFDVVWTSC